MLIIDTHSHIIPKDFSCLPQTTVDWPLMKMRDDGRADMFINGELYRVIERGYFDLEARLAAMDRDGIDIQVISPLPELLSYWLDLSTAVEMAKLVNQETAAAVKDAPGRIEGLGMLPLQDVKTAVAMVADIARLGLKGVEVGSNINGVSIADPIFDPVFAALEKHNLCVFVHGIRPSGLERLLGPKMMVNVIGIPQDCASAIASFISMDILGKFPALRLGFAHAGGSFGSMLGRMDFVWHEFERFRAEGTVAPRDYVKKFFFDCITYDENDFKHLIKSFGVETFFCGSDGPAIGAQGDLKEFVLSACENDVDEAEKILSKNALRFLNL